VNGTAKSVSTRQAIVAAARSVFVDVGYFDARVADIVAAADVSQGSFYTYFPSKREVFEEVVNEVGMMIRNAVAHTDADVPGQVVRNLENANRRYLRVHHDNARLLALVDQVSSGDPELERFRIAGRRHHVERVERTITSLQERGLADPHIDPHTSAGALVSMLSSFAHWSSILSEEYEEEAVVQTVTDIWVKAIGLRGG
jgi:AcrR family transcriptional regulator